jgi:AbiV family abortive infection protein
LSFICSTRGVVKHSFNQYFQVKRENAMVTEKTLIEGVWFAMEQAGRLVTSAVTLYEAGDFSSSIVLAMFVHEELGRSRILLDMAVEVNQGKKKIRLDDVRKVCSNHLEKQKHGALSVVYHGIRGEPLADAMYEQMRFKPGTAEYELAQKNIDQKLNNIAVAQPKDRHDTRIEAVYVDLNDDGKSWQRPRSFTRQEAFQRVNDAANDYSAGSQWFTEPLFSSTDPGLLALSPKWILLKPHKPAGLQLPIATWPSVAI